jgi:hypothetical protein
MTRRASGATVLLVGAFGGVVLGPLGALAAGLVAAAVLLTAPSARGAFAGLAALLLLASAVSALVETPLLDRWPVTFALDRPIAGALGAAAAVALFALIVVAAITERVPVTDPTPGWDRLRVGTTVVRDAIALGAVAAVGLLLRSAVGAADLPAGVEVVEANLRGGIGYATGLPGDLVVAPLTPALLFTTGLGARVLAAAALLAVAVEGGALARRAGWPALAGAGAAVVIPSVGGASVPVLLATALLGGGVLLVHLATPTPRQDLAAGALASASVLADPSALAGAACLLLWLVLERRTPRRAVRVAAPVLVTAWLLVVGVARLSGDRAWWSAGGDLPSHDLWLGGIQLGAVAAAVVAVVVRRRGGSMLLGAGAVAVAVATAHIGRDGSPSWVWASLLLVALVLGADQGGGGPSSSRSSSVTSRYHMSAQSTQR